jgi:hypothetical protein
VGGVTFKLGGKVLAEVRRLHQTGLYGSTLEDTFDDLLALAVRGEIIKWRKGKCK